MIDAILSYEGNGRWTTHPTSFETVDEAVRIGDERRAKITEASRTVRSNARFHAILKRVYDHLPESLETEYPTVLRFRCALLCKHGWCSTMTVSADSFSENEMVMIVKWLMSESDRERVFICKEGDSIVIKQADSQAFEKQKQADFNKSSEAVLRSAADLVGVSLAQFTERYEPQK